MAEIFDITSDRRNHTQLDLLSTENTWEKIQNCSVTPTESYHLVNKRYVDKTIGLPKTMTISGTVSKEFSVQAGIDKSVTCSGTASTNLTASGGVAKTVTVSGQLTYSGSHMGSYSSTVTGNVSFGVTFLSNPSCSISGRGIISGGNGGSWQNVKITSVSTTSASISATISGVGTVGGTVPSSISGTYDYKVTATGYVSGSQLLSGNATKTVSYGTTFLSTPTISNASNCSVSNVGTTSATVTVPVSGYCNTGNTITLSGDYSFVASGKIDGLVPVGETITESKSFGVTFIGLPTITNLNNCEVSDLTADSATVTVELSGNCETGKSVTLTKDYSFVISGNIEGE